LTLKNHKPHFNIKFLKGYGFSINVKDSKIILKNNFDPFSEPQTEEWFAPSFALEICCDHVKVKVKNIKIKTNFFYDHFPDE